jgi:hypothetical protein
VDVDIVPLSTTKPALVATPGSRTPHKSRPSTGGKGVVFSERVKVREQEKGSPFRNTPGQHAGMNDLIVDEYDESLQGGGGDSEHDLADRMGLAGAPLPRDEIDEPDIEGVRTVDCGATSIDPTLIRQ